MHLGSKTSKKKKKGLCFEVPTPPPCTYFLERWIAVYVLAHLVHSWDSLCAQAFYSFSMSLFLLRGAFLE